MKFARVIVAIVLFSTSLMAVSPACAGPPFDTDNPEPTDTGHWEIYLANSLDGQGSIFEGETEVEANFGAAEKLQLTVSIPLSYVHDSRTTAGLGDVELAAKYRFINLRQDGFSVAAFPNIALPTATNGFTSGRVTALLPIWAQKDIGKWALFGGAGYAINPGADNQNYWVGGVALSREVSERLLIGIEATREGSTFVGDKPTNTLGIGMIRKLKQPFSLLLRGGPRWEAGGKAEYHLYAALGLDF